MITQTARTVLLALTISATASACAAPNEEEEHAVAREAVTSSLDEARRLFTDYAIFVTRNPPKARAEGLINHYSPPQAADDVRIERLDFTVRNPESYEIEGNKGSYVWSDLAVFPKTKRALNGASALLVTGESTMRDGGTDLRFNMFSLPLVVLSATERTIEGGVEVACIAAEAQRYAAGTKEIVRQTFVLQATRVSGQPQVDPFASVGEACDRPSSRRW